MEKFIRCDVDSFLGFRGDLKSFNDLVFSLGVDGNREGEDESVGNAVGVAVTQDALADPFAICSVVPISNVICDGVST